MRSALKTTTVQKGIYTTILRPQLMKNTNKENISHLTEFLGI